MDARTAAGLLLVRNSQEMAAFRLPPAQKSHGGLAKPSVLP